MIKFFGTIWSILIILVNIGYFTANTNTPFYFIVLINLLLIYFFFLIFENEFT
jgi:hypothetical protein